MWIRFMRRCFHRPAPPDGKPLFFEGAADNILKVEQDGLLEGLGLFVEEREPATNPGFRFPEGTASYVLVAAFYAFEHRERVMGPTPVWGVPLEESGAVHPDAARVDVGVDGLIAPDLRAPDAIEESRKMISDLNHLMVCAMWCVFCLSVERFGYSRTINRRTRFFAGAPKGSGRWTQLDVSALIALLDDEGGAREEGLGPALHHTRGRFA